MLLSFEGIDGCGKSTQIKLLQNYLKNTGYKSYLFREPGGTEVSEKIRSLLLHESDELDPVSEMLLFSAARSQLIAEKVIPLIKKGEIVILDRFYDSTTAYQGYGRKSVPLDKIQLLNNIASHGIQPDITFYLKIDPLIAQKRTESVEKDRMEKSGLEFFRDVAGGFDELSKSEKRFKTLDATLSVEEIHQKITSILAPHL